MDIKKNPNSNLEDKKATYTLIGLVVVLALIFVSLEWTDKEITIYESDDTAELVEEEMIEQTFQNEPPPPPPPEVEIPDVIEEIVIVEDDVETAELDFSSEDDEKTVQEVVAAPIEMEEEEVEEIFMIVEQQPTFKGGSRTLAKYFSNNVRYPVIAMENGIQGRVICQFTIWKDGSISDVKVLRKVDPSLDKEAIRLISNMPKWIPGKQRGKTVACKFTVPVNFMLR